MNPLKIFEKEPLDRSRLNWFTKIIVFFIEWIARFMASLYLSLILIILGILPLKRFSYTFIRVLSTFCNMYKMRWMPGELEEEHGREGMDKTNGPEVPKVETRE